MKKALLLMLAILLFCPKSIAGEENISLLTKKGFFDKPVANSVSLNACDDIRKTIYSHLKYANTYNYEGLKSLYADTYSSSDGINKEIYFDLVKKTWESYPDIKYKININNIEVNGTKAIAQVRESAVGTTNSKSGVVDQKGLLESISNSVYYFEKINNEWLINSDYVISEKTFLRYGSAKEISIELDAPNQIPAGTPYTATLKMEYPKDTLIIASIGQESITYPQTTADEVFRKLPEDGLLERMFKSNQKNINEYAVASFGVTKAEIKKGAEIKIYVTGLGFVMSRVNVIPKNELVKDLAKVTKDEKNN